MTPPVIVGFAVVVLVAVLVGFAVPALIQVRRTARVVEEFVRGVTPRIENATSNLDSVLGRADRVMRGFEEGTRGIAGFMGSLGALLAGLRPAAASGSGAALLSALASLLSGLWSAWSVVGAAPQAGAPPSPAAGGGQSHA